MKKIFLIAAIVAFNATAFASCSGNNAPAENAEPAEALAETNAGVESEATAEGEAAVTADKSAASNKGVVVLKDDNKYRPGMKVNRLTILDFNATWCGPCKQFAPAFHAAAERLGDKVEFVSIDTDVNPQTANAFQINAIPTVIFIYPNGKSKRYVGTQDLLPESQFISLVEREM